MRKYNSKISPKNVKNGVTFYGSIFMALSSVECLNYSFCIWDIPNISFFPLEQHMTWFTAVDFSGLKERKMSSIFILSFCFCLSIALWIFHLPLFIFALCRHLLYFISLPLAVCYYLLISDLCINFTNFMFACYFIFYSMFCFLFHCCLIVFRICISLFFSKRISFSCLHPNSSLSVRIRYHYVYIFSFSFDYLGLPVCV